MRQPSRGRFICRNPRLTLAEHLTAVAGRRDAVLPGALEDDVIEPLRLVLAAQVARQIGRTQRALWRALLLSTHRLG